MAPFSHFIVKFNIVFLNAIDGFHLIDDRRRKNEINQHFTCTPLLRGCLSALCKWRKCEGFLLIFMKAFFILFNRNERRFAEVLTMRRNICCWHSIRFMDRCQQIFHIQIKGRNWVEWYFIFLKKRKKRWSIEMNWGRLQFDRNQWNVVVYGVRLLTFNPE